MDEKDGGGKEYVIDRFLGDLSVADTVVSSQDWGYSDDDTAYTDFSASVIDEQDVTEWKPTNEWKHKGTLQPIEEVLFGMEKFKWELMGKTPKKEKQEKDRSEETSKFKVKSLHRPEVLEKIDDFVCETVNSLIGNSQFRFHIPSHKTVYDKVSKSHVIVQLKERTPTVNMASRKKAACYARILEVVHRSLVQRVPVSLSFLYYQDPVIFGHDRYMISPMLDNLCLKFGCNRRSLNVFGAEKALVKGALEFTVVNVDYNCVDEINIPPNIGNIRSKSLRTDAKFILIVEKHSVYNNIVNDHFEKRYNCIIITAKGQPDLSTRTFLKILCANVKIPVFALMDGDPYGFDIMAVYKFGSKNMAYDNLALKRIVWLGLLPSDVETLDIPRRFLIPLSNTDLDRCTQLLSQEYVKDNADYVEELKLMMEKKLKIELDALSGFDMRYIPRFYLPFKLQQAVEQAGIRNQIFRRIFAKKETHILMKGLDATGKTTILHKLKFRESITIIPTSGIPTSGIPTSGILVETFEYKSISFTVWDVGNRDKISPEWMPNLPNPQGLIFVVDSSDRDRVVEAKDELHSMLNEDELRDAVLLVFANKQDLPDAMNAVEITDKLGLQSLGQRHWHIQSTCATSGDGLYEGWEWLSDNIPNKA